MQSPSHLPADCRVIGRFRGASLIQLHASVVRRRESRNNSELGTIAQGIRKSHQPANRVVGTTGNVYDGSEDDSDIEPERSIGNVLAIEYRFLANRFDGGIRRQLNLGEPRNS